MGNINYFITMVQGSDLAATNLFPFPFKFHLIFSILAFIFFVFMFIREKKIYQAILSVAIPLSLCLWISDSRTLFQVIGLTELILIIVALVSTVISKKRKKSAQIADITGEHEE